MDIFDIYTCTRLSGRLILFATSSLMNTSGYFVFAKSSSRISSWDFVNVVRSRRCFRGGTEKEINYSAFRRFQILFCVLTLETSSTLRRRNLKTQQSPVILDLCLRKTRSGKSRDYRDVIVFEKLRLQNVSVRTKTKNRRFQIPPVWKPFWLRFRDGLVSTEGLTQA